MIQLSSSFREQVLLLDIEIKNYYKDAFMRDGIIDIEKYINAQTRILWILKEPYDTVGMKSGWSGTKDIREERALSKKENSKNGNATKTWHPIAYVSYGILKENKSICEIGDIYKNKSINEALLEIAFINIQKFPKPAYIDNIKRTFQKDIKKAFDEHKEILLRQIEIYNPDIVIEATNLKLVTNTLPKDKFRKTNQGHFYNKERIYINTFHPSQLKISPKEYINLILQRVSECKVLQSQ